MIIPKEFLEKALDRPESVLQLIICILLAILLLVATVLVIINSDTLSNVLVLTGICVMALCAVLNKGAFVGILVILIVGTVVAPRAYIISITHMLTRPDNPVDLYLQHTEKQPSLSGHSMTSVTNNSIPTRVRNKINEIVNDQQGTSPVDHNRINQIVSNQITPLVGAVRVERERARYPLEEVVGGNARRLADEYEDVGYFISDMNFLRSLELISFPNSRFHEATPTELGVQVLNQLQDDTDSAISNTLFERNLPAPEEIPTISIGRKITGTFLSSDVVWHRFSVDEEQNYVIAVDAEFGDPLARLYGPDKFALITEDDDGGSDLNSKIKRELGVGEYYVGIINLMRNSTEFSINLSHD